MTTNPASALRFHQEHSWARPDGANTVVVGITQHAQETLGDIVFVDLPELGKQVTGGEVSCIVESVKAAADMYAPVSGQVIEVNEALRNEPGLANSYPEGKGWLYRLELSQPKELDALMDEATYRPFAASA
jgi:glycine cleavage system H protein